MGIKLKTNAAVLALVCKAKRANHEYTEYTVADHDAAVAHALMRAIGEIRANCKASDHAGYTLTIILARAAEILRDDFGIDED